MPPSLTKARILAVLIAALVLFHPDPSSAQSTPRAADHGTFARMVFDWDEPVHWSADVINNQLVLRFDHPVSGNPQVLLKPLGHYLKGVTVGPDRRILSFPLAVPIQIKSSFMSGTSTVVDIAEAQSAAASVARTDAAGAAPPATAASDQPARAAPSAPLTDVPVRGGVHPDFNRVVFDWPKPVEYSVTETGTQIVLAFERPARISETALTAALPSDVSVAAIHPEGKGTAVVLAVPPGLRARHYAIGPKVVLDLVRTGDSAPPPPRSGTSAPPPDTEEGPPALQPLAPQPAPALTLPPAPTAAAAKTVATLPIAANPQSTLAVFRRAAWIWLVISPRVTLDPQSLQRAGGGTLAAVELIPTRVGTVLRMQAPAGLTPVPRRDPKTGWTLDLVDGQPPLQAPLAADKQFDFETRGRLEFTGTTPAHEAVQIRDPEVGDTILAMPVATAGAGVAGGYDLPEATILPTAQGVAVLPKADGLHLDAMPNAIEVSMPGGVVMSHAPIAPAAPAPAPALPTAQPDHAVAVTPPPAIQATGPLDIGRWSRGGIDSFEKEHQRLQLWLTSLPPDARSPARIELARHDLANGMDAETLGVLKVAAAADPALENTAPFRALRGVANFLMGRDDEAIADLSHPSLANDPNAQLWLAAARARRTGDFTAEAPALRRVGDNFDGWSGPMRLALGRVAVLAEAAAGDGKSAARIVSAIAEGNGFSDRDRDAIAYLKGVAAETNRQDDQAVAFYREAEAGKSRPDGAYAARNRIELQLRHGQISLADAVHQLDLLRFAWRGEGFEYQLLKRLGEILIDNGQYAEGLRRLRSLATNFPDNPDIGTVTKKMADTFTHLFLDGAADKLPAVAAIGLFDEFHDLMPPGDPGNKIQVKMADRLAAIDLLGRAESMLQQVDSHTQDAADKARIAARLAEIQLTDHKAADALATLDGSEAPNLPPDLYNQRRYLRVRVLAAMGRTAEALALLVNDQSDTAKTLRTRIYWDLKSWPDAAASIESTLPQPVPGKPLDPQLARRVMDLATALVLAKDERGMQRLRQSYGPLMAATPWHDAFTLLSTPPERGIPDYRHVADKVKQAVDFENFLATWQKQGPTPVATPAPTPASTPQP